jgi:hypothetical protein
MLVVLVPLCLRNYIIHIFQLKVWRTLESDGLFHSEDTAHSIDEQKRLTALQLMKYIQYGFYTEGVANKNYKKKVFKLFCY